MAAREKKHRGFRKKSSSIRHRMNLAYTVALLVPLTIVGVLLLSMAQQTLTDYYIELLETDNRRVRTLLTEVTIQAYDASTEICYDTTAQNLLRQDYQDSSEYLAAVNAYNNLGWLNYNSLEIASIYIYCDNPTIQNYRQFRVVTEEIACADWYQKALDDTSAFWVSIETESFTGVKDNLCLVRRVMLSNSPYNAVAVVQVSDSYIRSRVDSGTIIDAVSVDDQGIVYSSSRELYGKPQLLEIDYADQYYRTSGVTTVDGERYFAAVSTINLYRTNSAMYVCTLDNSGFADMQRIITIWAFALMLAALIPLLIIFLFSSRFASRVNRLRDEMHKARLQNYDIRSEFGGNDELTEAFEDLKIMVQDIKDKDAKMYEAELNEKELKNRQQLMEFKMLSAQINPHYLYNTLETIRMKSLAGGNREVADSIKILGKTLHYVLENTGTAVTTLQKELDHVENYLAIQRLRFGERINYTLQIQPGLNPAECTVLPLLLQPVVENAVTHGLETREGIGMIDISVEKTDAILYIRVADSGSGIAPEELARILDGLEAEQMPRSSIALYNIHQRIRLRYGEQFGLAIQSTLGQGTCVTLSVPAE